MSTPLQPTTAPTPAEDAPRNRGDAVGLYRTEIRYDAEMRMEALYINDGLVGYSDTKTNADRALTILVADLIAEREARQVFTPEQAAIIADYWPTQAEYLTVK
jgi:hypothetical protein